MGNSWQNYHKHLHAKGKSHLLPKTSWGQYLLGPSCAGCHRLHSFVEGLQGWWIWSRIKIPPVVSEGWIFKLKDILWARESLDKCLLQYSGTTLSNTMVLQKFNYLVLPSISSSTGLGSPTKRASIAKTIAGSVDCWNGTVAPTFSQASVVASHNYMWTYFPYDIQQNIFTGIVVHTAFKRAHGISIKIFTNRPKLHLVLVS